MNQTLLKTFMKKNVPDIKVGDNIKVHIKVIEGEKERVQIFEGLVIAAKHGKSIDGTFTVRKEFHGVGVERVFPLHSPRIIKVERIKQSKVRRAKLYFMRDLKGKHTRMKELNRDYKMWEEPEAEEELAKLEAEKAKAAEAAAAKKAAKDAELAEKADAALASRNVKAEEEPEKAAGQKASDLEADEKVKEGSKQDERVSESTEEKTEEIEEDKGQPAPEKK